MRVGLLSDTHAVIDEVLLGYFETCDEIWHAGDFGSAEVFDRLSALKPLRGVWGNIDGPEIRSRLPQDLIWHAEGMQVYMTHIGGYPGRYDRRAKQQILRERPAVFICGHSHVARVLRDPTLGLLHLNPGASGHSGWHKERTAMRFEIEATQVRNLELIKLGPRGRKYQGP
jgi:putative phosphoesterase